MAARKGVISCLLFVAVILIGLGLFLFFGVSDIIREHVENKLVIAPGSAIYQNWIDSSVPIHLRIYLFNCTNAEEVLQQNAKPILQELGPYTFREHRVKVDIRWHSNDTVSFNEKRSLNFAPELSHGSLLDLVTNLNVPIIAAAYMIHNENPDVNELLSETMTMLNESIFTTRSVGEWLFDGFNSSFIDFAMHMNWSVPYDKFGWFYKKNNSDDGRYSIFTGRNDISKLSKIDTWNGSRKLPYWRGKCKKIKGGTGEVWPPSAEKRKSITLFNSDLKRSITLDFKSEEIVGSLVGHRFEVNFKTLGNSSINPSNRCYETRGKTYVSGIFDESGALGAPAFVSFPHFYLADPILGDAIEGLRPNRKEHNTFITVQPATGVPLSVAARFQINILLEPFSGIKQFNHVPRIIMPMFWLCETAHLDKETEQQIYLYTKKIPFFALIFGVISLSVAGFLILAVSFVICVTKVQKPATKKKQKAEIKIINK